MKIPVSELRHKLDGAVMKHPPYWTAVPNDWTGIISTGTVSYGNGVVGSDIRYVSSDHPGGRYPMISEALGEIVVHDMTDSDVSILDMEISDGNIIGRFGYYPISYREWTGRAPESPSWSQASKLAQGYAWGHADGVVNRI